MTSKTEIRRTDKWLFVICLLLLVAVFFWRLPAGEDSLDEERPNRNITPAPPAYTFDLADNSQYSIEDLEYFREIAFGSEHKALPALIRKWTDNITVRLEGDPTAADLLAVKMTMDEINQLQASVELSLGYFDANLVVRFAPESTFRNWHGNYRPTNLGYFWVRWVDEQIYSGNVLIDTQATSQDDRNGLIREEITQAMGLMDVSSRHPESIFNDDRNRYTDQLLPIDRTLLEMLYRPEILPSMTVNEALQILSQLTREEAP